MRLLILLVGFLKPAWAFKSLMLLRVLTDLVGSTLSDPYLSYSAALFALAGPLHG